jgi:F-type H+-transporting ATPase subunit b
MVLLAEGGLLEGLGINLWVLGIQVAIFVTTFLVLSNTLFKRILTFMQDREKEQADSAERVKKNREELTRVTAEYEERIAKVEKEAYAKLQAVLKEALEAKNKVVAEAQARAKAESDAAKAAIAAEKAQAMSALNAEVARLAKAAAERILEEPVDEAVVKRVVS